MICKCFILILTLFFLKLCESRILIFNNASSLIAMFSDIQADFGRDIPQNDGLLGELDVAKPANACLPILHKQISFPMFLLAEESESQEYCSYEKQAQNAQDAGYTAIIIYRRNPADDLVSMRGEGPAIVAVMVRNEAGLELKKDDYTTGAKIKIIVETELPFQLYLIPFVVVISICFFFMLLFSLGRYCRFRIRERRSRLSPANLKKIPTKKFKKGDEYDMCAICIEEYEENEKIRILPCNHAYHTKCVDPWLTSGKKLCPVCKQNVEPNKKKKKKKKRKRRHSERSHNFDQASTSSRNTVDEETSGSEVEHENRESANERTPLLSSDSIPSSGALNV